ncbi:arginine utilization protein RocB [Bacillus ectoiniformans]|uniref:M20/M25/M40 family metallo-hydrolase n=1 Tax=Bacillus ectoiniformans TaxID=1494429 RepID=UPI0019586A5D|nr:M20/M25/M40 family metallo-hydrolase [Bacillus ectoiniformans]MBM7649421.1 arginine utilization protein RocB [Bacillus ectoiniformans]
MNGIYQTKEQLTELLCELVAVPSISRTIEENKMAGKIKEKIARIPYYQEHPDHLRLHATYDGRGIITALAKKENAKKTIVLISHFDVVSVEDYGAWQEEAFQPKVLTELMRKNMEEYAEDVQEDLQSGEWLFGRGTMDMKAGLALHMSMIEQACAGEFEGNLLLLTVPDEEVSSVGMREAVPVLEQLAKEHDLTYELVLNGEPMFSLYPGDTNHYIYTGSIGKLLPGVYCYGRETHVGEPFLGLNASLMNSFVTQEIELNTDFCEQSGTQISPPPTALFHRDLKKDYSAQIPNRAASLYNVLTMDRSVEKTTEMLREAADRAAVNINEFYQTRNNRYDQLAKTNNDHSFDIKVMTFAELKAYAKEHIAPEILENLESDVLKRQDHLDDRELSIELVDQYALLCKELAPMIVLFYAPPFYPAVQSQGEQAKTWTELLMKYAGDQHQIDFQIAPYFNGICDLSYVSLQEDIEKVNIYISNVPVWGKTYDMPIEAMKRLQVPVLNLGPVGRDAHQQTERLHTEYAFVTLKDLTEFLLHQVFRG